jgi:hypothetical protein
MAVLTEKGKQHLLESVIKLQRRITERIRLVLDTSKSQGKTLLQWEAERQTELQEMLASYSSVIKDSASDVNQQHKDIRRYICWYNQGCKQLDAISKFGDVDKWRLAWINQHEANMNTLEERVLVVDAGLQQQLRDVHLRFLPQPSKAFSGGHGTVEKRKGTIESSFYAVVGPGLAALLEADVELFHVLKKALLSLNKDLMIEYCIEMAQLPSKRSQQPSQRSQQQPKRKKSVAPSTTKYPNLFKDGNFIDFTAVENLVTLGAFLLQKHGFKISDQGENPTTNQGMLDDLDKFVNGWINGRSGVVYLFLYRQPS